MLQNHNVKFKRTVLCPASLADGSLLIPKYLAPHTIVLTVDLNLSFSAGVAVLVIARRRDSS